VTPCTLWTGTITAKGYGRLQRGSRSNGTARLYYAHRWTWEQTHGPIPPGMEVDHLCRVRACVRLDHLELVTPDENKRRQRRATCRRGHPMEGANVREVRTKRGALSRRCRKCANLTPAQRAALAAP
jgi:hypothetical protein